ncbi:threonine-phosphate decarboxylase CobD [Mesobacillus zeae]|uniref:threonine-phosphate decarboxylase n=1 Tax=Mesobacillus zeae TaxID=1917180 RepID=A0A398BDK5_9BACI|nr:threonine-phosphate decarboxylase CobD [Mesobacillus zeae]RID85736.1 threonine-phosphate decarboxylase [Mesobacillus zeae]
MKWPPHGSNPQYLFETLGLRMPEKITDFSANINPLGPPPVLKEKWNTIFDQISDYPDPQGAVLKKKLAEKEGIHESQILIGNGGAEIIFLIGRLLAGKKAVVVEPAFSEYEQACRTHSCDVGYHQLQPGDWEWEQRDLSSKLKDAEALFLCNPNNPTGVYYSKEIIRHLLEECLRNDCLLIVDEAFYDFVPDYEPIVSYIENYSNLLVIRSMTKMFAIPGLRLGYIMGNSKIVGKLAGYQQHWSINTPALKAGEICLESESYVAETKRLVKSEREKLFTFYEENEFTYSPSSTNFYLLKDPTAKSQLPLFRFLLENGIVPRHTMNFPGLEGDWLRFAVKGSKDNGTLMERIALWKKSSH